MKIEKRSVLSGLLVAASLALTGNDLGAQSTSRTVTFEEAIEMALERNIDLVRAENSLASQSNAVTQRWMQFLPTFNASLQSGTSVGRAFSQDEGAIVNETTRSLSAGVSTSVTLFDGFRNLSLVEIAQQQEAAAAQELERTRETVVMAVASGFVSIIESAAQIRVREQALAAQRAELEQITALVEAGSRPLADQYQQQASMAATQSALVDARRSAEQAELEMIRTLRLEPTGEYEFVSPEIDDLVTQEPDEPLALLVHRALAHRHDLAAAEARREAAGEAVDAAAGGWWPTVSLGASYNTGASSASELGFEDQLDQRRGGSVSLSVSIPIFDRLSTSAAVQEAELQQEEAQLDLEWRRQEIALQVRGAVLDRDAARARLESAQAQLEAAELALEAVTERYRLGSATLVEVIQSRASQVEAAGSLVTARHELVLAKTLLDYYTGAIGAGEAVIRDV